MSVFTRPKKVEKGQHKRWRIPILRQRGSLIAARCQKARTKWQADTLIPSAKVYEGKSALWQKRDTTSGLHWKKKPLFLA